MLVSHWDVPLTRVFSTAGVVGVVGLLPPQPSASQQLYMYSNSAYPKLQAANGSTITIRNGTPESFLRAIDEVREGRMGFCKAGRLYGVSHATLQKYYKAMGYSLRNQTHNPNFRKRPDGISLEPRRRYYSVPTTQLDRPYLSPNSVLFPHIIVNPSSSNSRSQMKDSAFTGTLPQSVSHMIREHRHEGETGKPSCDPGEQALGSQVRIQPQNQPSNATGSHTFQIPCSTTHFTNNDKS